MWFNQKRFSIWACMGLTALAAMFCAAALTENEWLRGTIGTITSAMIVNAMLQAIFARGERRAFALSFFLGAMLYGPGAYTAVASLPYVITQRLLQLLGDMEIITTNEGRNNFYIVAVVFWLQVTCFASGFTGVYWYKRTLRESSEAKAEPSKLPV